MLFAFDSPIPSNVINSSSVPSLIETLSEIELFSVLSQFEIETTSHSHLGISQTTSFLTDSVL